MPLLLAREVLNVGGQCLSAFFGNDANRQQAWPGLMQVLCFTAVIHAFSHNEGKIAKFDSRVSDTFNISTEKDPTLLNEPDSSKCVNNTEPIVITIPCRLIERAQKYADEHGNTVAGVVIEALDALLGGRTTDGFR
jgi:hypothetical protein